MKKWETVEDIVADLMADVEAARAARLKPKPPTPTLTVASDHKLSLEGQREKVSREMQELVESEKARQECIETHRQRQERQRQEGLYYRRLYEATATAEFWAKQRSIPARRGEYDAIARFEQEIKDGV
jgi:hypothetical protein